MEEIKETGKPERKLNKKNSPGRSFGTSDAERVAKAKGELDHVLANDLLLPWRKVLIKKAIQMARKGNATIMNKLLDKLLPNLNAVDLQNAGEMPKIVINVMGEKKKDEKEDVFRKLEDVADRLDAQRPC